MDWAKRRAWKVIAILGTVVFAFLAVIGFTIFYNVPTCTDSKQNGEETGIDCGGSCSKVCSAEASDARVRFYRTLNQSGRIDLIAYIDNPNANAFSNNAHLLIDIYRQDGHILQKKVTVSIPAKGSTPIFIPGIANFPIQQIFVSFDQGYPVWIKGSGWDKEPPVVQTFSATGLDIEPKIIATVENKTAYAASQVPFVATVFADDGSVIAASQTVVSYIPAQGTAQAIFTWNEPFAAPYARVEIVPLLALPSLTQ